MNNEEFIIDLLLQAEDWRSQGRSFAIEELCPEHPELWSRLQDALHNMGQLERRMRTSQASGVISDDGTSGGASGIHRRMLPPIDGYELLEEIGHGGMGVVYRARQLGLNRVVAIKTFAGAFKEGSRERFHAEAETIARLHHANIVQIYDVGEAEGTPYFSMEWVSGGNLAQSMMGRPRAPRAAAELIVTIANAIHTAHARGIVHRDLKPANILLTPDGEPKISDFGLAKRLEEELALTRSQIIGTPSYMAPEQVRPGLAVVGAEADIYAMGVILYELLTGRVPHAGENSVETVIQVLEREPVPPSQLVPKLPFDLETICLKCLSKKPSHRYASAELLAADLRRWLNHEPILARPVGPLGRLARWYQRRPAVAALLVGVIVAVLAGLATTTWQWRTAVAATKISVEEQHKAEGERAKAIKFADDLRIQRDRAEWQTYRSTLFAAASALRSQQITTAHKYLQAAPEQFRDWEWRHLEAQLDGADAVLAGHRLSITGMDISPDGALILSWSADRAARIWDARTGRLLHTLAGHTQRMLQAIFSSDGALVATCSDKDPVRIWDSQTGELKLTLQAGVQGANFIAFTPQGQSLVCGTQAGTIHIFPNLKDSDVMVLGGPQLYLSPVALSPDGKELVVGAGDHTLRVIDIESGKFTETWRGHRGVALVGEFSSDGERFICTDNSTDHAIRLWDTRTGRTTALMKGHASQINYLAFSRDGSRIVTASMDQTARLWDGATGELIKELRGHTGFLTSASFNRDGSRILTSSDDYTARLWSADGEQLAVLRGHSGCIWAARFSPDGSRIVTASADATLRTWDLGFAENDGVLRGHTAQVVDVVFNPDGNQIISVGMDGNVRIWDAKREKQLQSHSFGTALLSSVSIDSIGKTLLVVQGRGEALYRLDLPLTGFMSPMPLPRGLRVGHRTAISPKQPIAAVVVQSRDVESGVLLLDLNTDQEIHQLVTPRPLGPYCVAFSPDGSRVLAGCMDGTYRVWSIDPPKLLQVGSSHRALIYDVCFNQSGSLFATASSDNHVRLWDAKTFEPRGDYIHGSPACCVRFSPAGTRLAVGCGDGTIRLWNLATGEEVADLRGHTDMVRAISFSPDGSTLVSAGDRTVRIWSSTSRRARSR